MSGTASMDVTFASNPKAALISYNQLGYHIEPNVWTEGECQKLVDSAESLPAFQNGNLAPAMQPHRKSKVFLDALCNPKLVGIMEQILDGKVSALQSEFFYCPPDTPGFAFHQDNYVLQAKYGAFASAWSPMQDVTPEMGSLIVFPGSHSEPILEIAVLPHQPHAHQDPNAQKLRVVPPAKYKPVALSVPKGASVIFHGNLIHGSGQNTSLLFRKVLLTTYIRSGEKFYPGHYAGRAEIDVYPHGGKVSDSSCKILE